MYQNLISDTRHSAFVENAWGGILGQRSPHVHVDRDDQSAKFWLAPIALARNLGFSPVELGRIHRMLKENEITLMERWNARFGS